MSVLFFFAIPPGISLLILIAEAADKARPPPHTLAYLTFIREMSFAMSEYKKPYINLCPLRNVPFFSSSLFVFVFYVGVCVLGEKKTFEAPLQFSPTFHSTPFHLLLLLLFFFCFHE